jgi:hypothetical protein
MVNILELELKSENKDQLLVAFGKTNPAANWVSVQFNPIFLECSTNLCATGKL